MKAIFRKLAMLFARLGWEEPVIVEGETWLEALEAELKWDELRDEILAAEEELKRGVKQPLDKSGLPGPDSKGTYYRDASGKS